MNWRRIIIVAFDCLIGVYLLLAMTAFNEPDERYDICKDVHITVEQDFSEGFLSDQDVSSLLRHSGVRLISQSMRMINTRQVEEVLQGNDLIDKAECYKANDGVVCVKVRQRVPVIRVISDNGDDYYVDNNGEVIQHNNYTCNLLVATGHISKKYASKVLAPIAIKIRMDKFWKNQIVQLNVLHDGSVEIVPRVGEHVAYVGYPTGIEKKLERLRKFYRYGLNEAGWNKYSRISVEFDNQIICKRIKK